VVHPGKRPRVQGRVQNVTMSRLDSAQWSTAPPPEKAFGGSTYDPKRDHARLTGQWLRVWDVMKDGRWRTLHDISLSIEGLASEAAISARLRDFRKARFGGHTVERLYIDGGLWEYRLIVRERLRP